VFDFTAKYVKGECTFECPANLGRDTTQLAEFAANFAYFTLGCRGLARVDFIVPKEEHILPTPVFLEINTIPGMTPTSLSPLSASVAGMNYGELCEAILQSAMCEQEEFPPAA
jgi:D-alanine-D-alanine ligase